MTRLFTFFSLALLFSLNSFAQVNVTFRVRMTGQTPSPLGIHLAGNFQNWQPDSTVMLNEGADVYYVTVALPPDSTYQFKFINGNAWGMDEAVPAGCATGGNRTVTIGTKDTVLPAYCYGTCNICTPTDSINVTFKVDMQNQTVSDSGVHIAADFESWSPGTSKMLNISGTVYAATFKLPANVTYQYKFINGPSWADNETVPAGCVTTGNRTVAIGAKDTTLTAYCFGSCSPCPPIVPIDSVNVTFQVDMQTQTVSDSGVHIAGAFQGWNTTSSLMTQVGTSTVYAATFRLPEDSTFQYKFINGNAAGADYETVPKACGVGNSLNRSISIGTKDTTLAVVCFNSCTACPVPPPPIDSVNVTFRVDMQNVKTVSDSGVHIAGVFQGWSPSKSLMTEVGTTTVYSATFKLPADSTYQFKFINGPSWPDNETVPAPCVTGGNRTTTLGGNDTTLPAFCFSSCNPCNYVPPPIDSVNVTFQVDMQTQTVSDSGVHIAGAFQGWNTTSSLLTNTGGTIYSKTFRLPEDSTFQYKFINGNAAGADYETVPKACGVGNSLNRSITIGIKDTILPVVCFSSCVACPPPPPPVDSINVTFQVDMLYQTVSDSGVHIAGIFQGWNPAKSLMTKVGTTSVYSATLRVAADSTLQYKFINGNAFPNAETVPAACGVTGDFNRQVIVGNNDTTLPVVCFSSCTACPPPPPPGDSINVTFQVDMGQQTVSANGVHLAGNFQGWNPATTQMYNTTGSIYAITLKITKDTSYQYKFINGNTFGNAETVPGACGVTVDLNREVTVATNDTTLPVVCFSSCTVCPPPNIVNVTFQVDMGNLTISPKGVHIMSNFQGWDPAGTPMVENGISTVYQIIIALPSNDSIQYRFVNGNLLADAETPPAQCTVGSTYERALVVPFTDYTIPLVCFSSCSACLFSAGTENIENDNDILVYPSPAKDYFNISMGLNKSYQVSIYDSERRLMQANVMNKPMNTIPLDNFSSGVYTIRFMNDSEVIVKKIMVTK